MNNTLKSFLKVALQKLGIGIVRNSTLRSFEQCEADLNFILNLPKSTSDQLALLWNESKSQLKQDLFVLAELDLKKDGYFVEFGAANGIDFSNTYLLEKEFAWNGILAEPAKVWHRALKENRNSRIETNCVWRDSDSILKFSEVDPPELSTIATYISSDYHQRQNELSYDVRTISLLDLLKKYNAPNVIDYLSIDTEGSEYEILRKFDFERYQFNVITCEHNRTPTREKVYKLLTRFGYVRKYTAFSRFDDWYFRLK